MDFKLSYKKIFILHHDDKQFVNLLVYATLKHNISIFPYRFSSYVSQGGDTSLVSLVFLSKEIGKSHMCLCVCTAISKIKERVHSDRGYCDQKSIITNKRRYLRLKIENTPRLNKTLELFSNSVR